MGLMLSTYKSLGEVDLVVGLAVLLGAEECGAPVVTDVMLSGGWR